MFKVLAGRIKWFIPFPWLFSLNLVDKFTYLGSYVSSTENGINTRFAKGINKLLVILKSDQPNRIKHNFFQSAVLFMLVYGCTIWTLTKRIEKNLDGNCTGMLRDILNKSRKQHLTKQQLDHHLPLISKTIQIRRRRHAGQGWRSKDNII